VEPNRDRKYLHCRILAVSGRIFLATSVSPNVDGPSRRIFERSNFRSKHRSLTLAVRKNALLNRDREGAGASKSPAALINIQVDKSSDKELEDEVIALIREWRFETVLMGDVPVVRHAHVELSGSDPSAGVGRPRPHRRPSPAQQ
jgi:hypothetical protein